MILGYRETIVKIRGEIWEVNLRRRKTITHYKWWWMLAILAVANSISNHYYDYKDLYSNSLKSK